MNRKVLFIGIDGASKKIVDKLIREKKLPAIEKLINEGSYFCSHAGDLGSSPIIWTSIATAKKPEKHGITNFYGTSQDVTAKRVWEIFNELGFPVGVMGHFISWPPKEVNGFMIPDLLALDNRCYPEKYGFMWDITYSEKTQEKLNAISMLRYFGRSLMGGVKIATLLSAGMEYIRKKTNATDKFDTYFSSRAVKTKFHRDLFIRLLKEHKPKYSFLHIHLVDGCSHRFWKYMEPEHYQDVPASEIKRHGNKVYDAYRYVDKIVQDVINVVDSNTIVVVASDHGFKASSTAIHWMNDVTLNVMKFVDLFDEDVRKDLNFSLVLPIISLSIRNVTPEKYEYCKKFLKSIIVSEYQKPLFKVFEADHNNLALNFNGEIDEVFGKHISLNGETLPLDDFLIKNHGFSSGIHDTEDGVLILNGPGVKKNIQGKHAVTIFDLIPTILALCNLPIGKDMDGKVITDMIENDFIREFPVQYIDSYENKVLKTVDSKTDEKELSDEETERLKDQLKNLGYL